MFDRNDVTWLLSALRAGADLETVQTLAKGIDARRLGAAYHELEVRRAESVEAWGQLCAHASLAALREYGPAAARLLPVPVARLAAAPSAIPESLAVIDAEIHKVHQICDVVERTVAELATFSVPAAQLEARRLWGPAGGCLWNDPYFLPRRVGELTPIRAVDLLDGLRNEDLT